MNRPNIIYIHSHDTGRYLQPYGHAVPTPRIQQLAEQGVLFRQAFAAAPTCCPSRAALLTGQSAHESGMLGLVHRGFSLKDPQQHLANVLKRNGYSTHLCGIQHEAESAKEIGYDHEVPSQSRMAKHVGPAAAGFLKSAPQQPFFLAIGFFETHRHETAFVKDPAKPMGDPRYVRPPAPMPDLPEIRRDMADYIESAKRLDAGVGQVLDALDATGLAENTLVISTTDHGVPFVGMKSYLTDHGTGVSLILRGPGGFAGGKVVDAMVSHLDVFPTIAELAGFERPAWLSGESLLPLVRDNVATLHDELFGEITYHAGYDPQRSVRTTRWKYIRRFGDRTARVLCNNDDGMSKVFLVAHGLRDQHLATEQLYDLMFDPNEANNVAGDPANAAVLAEMRQRLDAWMRRTHDPLLHGPVPPPPGALVSDPDDLSPNDVRRRQSNAKPIPS